VLVDTGTGGVNGVGGALIANLALLGVRPEEIDTILLTHAHPDHIGGLLTAAGTPAYPNATVFLPSREQRLLAGGIDTGQRQRSRPAQRAARPPRTGDLRGANS
jgi:glyoxylase-like metal-dependent hydrolase (beta-lactamase superfamily II)